MKQKLANYLKLGILFFGISLLMFGCQNDEPIIEHQEHSYLEKGRIENFNKLTAFVEKLNKKPKEEVDEKTTSLETTNGFDIIYDQDLYLQEENGVETFSIPIHKHNQKAKTFSNLIVSFSDTEPTEAFILTYHPEDAYIQAVSANEQTPFLGSIRKEIVNYDGSLDYLKIGEAEDCETFTIRYCTFGEETGNVHIGGSNCTEGYYWDETITICNDDEYSLQDIPYATGSNPVESSTDNGDYSTAGTDSDGTTTQEPIVVPNPPRTFSIVNIDAMSLEMTEWLNQLENIEFKEEIVKFLDEEGHLPNTDLEAYLLIKSESSSTQWQDYSGSFNNIPSLQFSQIRHEVDYSRGYTYTEVKLLNGDTILYGDFARTIDEDGNSFTTEPDERIFYNSKENKRLFTIPEPYNQYPSVDISHLWTNFWGAVQVGVRYCTPLEDFVILIDGKDFDGVEQSRAVSGISILIDNVPFGKVFKIVKRAGQTIDASIPIVRRFTTNIFKVQRKLVKEYKGVVSTMSNLRKGNFGEMATDVDLISKGYKDLHVDRITNIDTPTSQGIDHVFKNPETGQYLIVESKYTGSSSLSTLADGTRQMSDDWIIGGDRLFNAIGQDADLYNDIINNGYERILAKAYPDGTVVYRKIGADGYVILGNAGNFTP